MPDWLRELVVVELASTSGSVGRSEGWNDGYRLVESGIEGTDDSVGP